MNTANWKIPAVLAATLLAALGLQAGAIKLMLNSDVYKRQPATVRSR